MTLPSQPLPTRVKCYILESKEEIPPLISFQDLPNFTMDKAGTMKFDNGNTIEWTIDPVTKLYVIKRSVPRRPTWAMLSSAVKG